MASLMTTHPTEGIRGHCDKGHQTCGLLMNKHPTHVPQCPTLHFPVAARQDQWPKDLKASVLEAETLGMGQRARAVLQELSRSIVAEKGPHGSH